MSIWNICFQKEALFFIQCTGTFQRCMMSIFSDMIKNGMEVFMNDFSVFESTYDQCLEALDIVLQQCESSNLVLN